eukprot:8459811-Heterocapsa_arctica.AAC.1
MEKYPWYPDARGRARGARGLGAQMLEGVRRGPCLSQPFAVSSMPVVTVGIHFSCLSGLATSETVLRQCGL